MARGGVLAKPEPTNTICEYHLRKMYVVLCAWYYVLLDSPFHLVAQTEKAWANSMK